MTKKLLLIAFFLVSVKLVAQSPILSNFRVEDSNKNRVYFNSEEALSSGSSYDGFTISGKTVSGVFINSGSDTGHYFSVSNNFTFWDNNTIEYSGTGSNISDGTNNVSSFTLSYIENNISEPTLSGNVYYVDRSSGSDSNSGSSEGEAWRTIQKAFNSANAGDKVWIKAGNYGNENIRTQRSGSSSNPIIFEGYKNTIGDIDSNYWIPYSNDEDVTSLPLDANEMPLLEGNDPDENNGIEFFSNHDFIVIKNIQIRSYFNGVLLNNNDGVYFKNVNIRDIGIPEGRSSNAFDTSGSQNSRFRFEDCIVVNAEHAGWWLWGSHHLMKNCEFYYDLAGTTSFDYGCDYPFMIAGDHHIITGSKIHYKVNKAHLGHGFNMKYVTEYNLIDNCLAINTTGYKTRYSTARYNVIKNSEAHANVSHAHPSATGINMLNDPNNNIYENMYVHDLTTGIYAAQNTEDPTTRDLANNNTIRNSVFANVSEGIFLRNEAVPQVSGFSNNKIYNNTFYNVKNLFTFATKYGGVSSSGNEFKNNIVHTSPNKDKTGSGYTASSGFEIDYNNFFNSFPQIGSNSLSVDPKFVNISLQDFSLQPDSECIDVGIVLDDVPYDFIGNARPSGSSHDMGAFEKKNEETGSSIDANAGDDITICSDSSGNLEEVTLNASGGSSYEWSTGETTASITVNPTETTEYTVTVFEGDDSASDSVTVTVENAPVAVASEDVAICEGETVTLTVEGEGDFTWSNGSTESSIEVSPTSTTTYTVTATNSCSESTTDSVTITVSEAIDLTVSENVTICIGETVELTAVSNELVLWDTGSTDLSIEVSPTSTTTYTVTSSNENCVSERSVTVTVNDVPSVVASDDVSTCAGEVVTLTASGEGDFLWSNGATGASIEVNPTNTTTYTVTASNSCSLDATDEVVVTVSEPIDLTVSENITICSGDSVILTAASTESVLWDTGSTDLSIDVSPTSTTTYTVTSSNANCTSERSVTVTVSEVPSVVASDDVSTCAGEVVTLTAIGEGEFLWSNGSTESSIEVNPSSTTTYTVTASNAGCSLDATDEVVVTVSEAIDLTVSENVTICAGETATLTAESNETVLWDTGSTDLSIDVSPTSTTTYTVTSSNANCTSERSVIVIVNSMPSVIASDDVSICAGETVTLTAFGEGEFIWSNGATGTSIEVNPTSTTTYTVTASNSCSLDATDQVVVTVSEAIDLTVSENITICAGETITLTASSNAPVVWNTGSTNSSITVSPSSSRTYTVSSSNASCTDQKSVSVTVNRSPSVVASNDISICAGQPVTLTASGVGNFTWSNGATGSSIQVSPTSTSTYRVIASNSCSSDATDATDEVVVTVNPSFTVNAGNNVTICNGESTTLTATGTGSFLWSTGETTASITVNPTITTRYTVSSGSGNCSMTDSVRVTVVESASVDAGSDVSICLGENVTLTASGSGSFLWSTGETTSSISVSPSITQTYSVTASSTGCASTSTDNVTVTVYEMPSVEASNDIVIEEGASQTLTATGSGTFKWSTGEIGPSIQVSPLSTTIYTVTADTGNGCTDEDRVLVTVVDPADNTTALVVSVGQNVSICPGRTVVLEADEGDSYLWSTGETERSITTNPQETTIYSVKVTNGAESTTNNVTVFIDNDCANIFNKELVVFPNPTKGVINIEITGFNDMSNLTVYNLNGVMIYSERIDNSSKADVLSRQIDLSRYTKGIYFVRIVNGDSATTKKVIVI